MFNHLIHLFQCHLIYVKSTQLLHNLDVFIFLFPETFSVSGSGSVSGKETRQTSTTAVDWHLSLKVWLKHSNLLLLMCLLGDT